jgi:hypothetical protein
MLAKVVLILVVCNAAANAQPGPAFGGRPLKEWVDDLQSKYTLFRRLAAKAIGEIGPRAAAAVPALLSAYSKESSAELRVLYVQALGKIGPNGAEALPALEDALIDVKKGEVDEVRKALVDALLRIDERPAERAATILERAYQSRDAKLPTLVVRRIAGREKLALQCLKQIVAGMQHDDAEVRGATLECLLQLESAARTAEDRKKIRAAIEAALEDSEAMVRLLAIRGRAARGPAALPYRDRIAMRMVAPPAGAEEREAVFRAIVRIDPELRHSAAVVTAALQDKETKIRLIAIKELAGHGNKAAGFINDLAVGMKHDDRIVRRETLEAALAIDNDPERLRPILTPALTDSEAVICLKAIRHISEARAARYTKELTAALNSTNIDIRIEAIGAIVRCDPDLRDCLEAIEAAAKDKDSRIRAAAAVAIGNLGERGKRFAELLKSIENDKSDAVRTAARDALADIDFSVDAALPAELLTLFPPKTEVIAHLQFQTLLDFIGARNHLLDTAREGIKSIDSLRDFHFDPFKDVSSATLVGRGLAPGQFQLTDGLLILRGTFPNAEQGKILEAHRGPLQFAVCIQKRWILLSDSKQNLEAAMQRAKANRPIELNIPLRDALASLDGRATFRLASSLSSDFQDLLQMTNAPMGLTSVAVQIAPGDQNLTLRALFNTQNAASAAAWKQYVDELHAQVQQFAPLIIEQYPQFRELAQALDKAQIKADGSRVRVTIKMPIEAIDQVFKPK